MEVDSFSSGLVMCSVMEAVVLDAIFSAGKALTCLLMMTSSLLSEFSVSPDERFPFGELHKRQKTAPENKDSSDTEDDDEEDDGEDADADDPDDEDFSGEEGEDDENDPEDDPLANGQGGSDDDDDDGDEGDDNEEDEDDEDEEDEDDDEVPQPPAMFFMSQMNGSSELELKGD